MSPKPSLTSMHMQILYLTATGSSVEAIKNLTGLKQHSFNRYWEDIYEYFDVHTKCGAISRARTAGLLELPVSSLKPHLAPLEKRIIQLLVSGLSTEAIAAKLGKEEHHVCVCISNVMSAYHVHAREHLVAILPQSQLQP